MHIRHRVTLLANRSHEWKEDVEDYRSAKEILDDCFSSFTASTKTGSSDSMERLNGKEGQPGSGVIDRRSRPCRATSQERKVRSLVLDTRYNRLLLVKSKMSDAEALRNDIIRTNSLPSSRRRSRFQ